MRTNKSLKRSLPYIHSLQNGLKSNSDKIALLKRFPDFVLKDIIEVLINIVNKNCNTPPKARSHLLSQKRSVVKFLDHAKKHKHHPKLALNNQKGQFIGAILPAILSVLSSL